jgi:hypothetical protein
MAVSYACLFVSFINKCDVRYVTWSLSSVMISLSKHTFKFSFPSIVSSTYMLSLSLHVQSPL